MWRYVPLLYLPLCDGAYLYYTYLHVTVRTSLYLPLCDGAYFYYTYIHVTVRTSIILTFVLQYLPLLYIRLFLYLLFLIFCSFFTNVIYFCVFSLISTLQTDSGQVIAENAPTISPDASPPHTSKQDTFIVASLFHIPKRIQVACCYMYMHVDDW